MNTSTLRVALNSICALAAFHCTFCVSASAQEYNIEVQLRTGSKFVMTTSQDGIKWNGIQERAKSKPVHTLWADFLELRLIETPVGKRVTRIQLLLDQLSDPSYSVREAAEASLSDPKTSGPFIQLIKARKDQDLDPESSYRIRRVLQSLADVQSESEKRFDEMVIRDGTSEIGDAAISTIKGSAMGQSIALNRNQILSIKSVLPKSKTVAAEPIAVSTFNTNDGEFYKDPSDTVLSFELGEHGAPMKLGAINNKQFTGKGLLMETESAGYIQLIKYPFKHCPIDTGNRCICTFDEATNKRLRGATIITFCDPELPNVAAGVKRFGVFLERIEHSRDFVVEAFNSRNQIIGMVEATDQICVFAGFRSNELITKIRISKNENLPELDRNVDETYAFDCVTFDRPTSIRNIVRSENGNLVGARIDFHSGSSLVVDQVFPSDDFVAIKNPVTGEDSEIAWNEVRSIAFNRVLPTTEANRNHQMVQLKNGSIVRTEANSIFSTYDFVGHQFQADQITGIWSGTARLPEATDFETGKPIAVYPGCRIVLEELDLAAEGFRWNQTSSKKIVQAVRLTDEDNDVFGKVETPDPDLTPDVDQVTFGDDTVAIPSLWLARPLTNSTEDGYVQLTDGQYFILGEDTGFGVEQIDEKRKSITVSLDGITKTYPLTRVVSLSLPKPAVDQ